LSAELLYKYSLINFVRGLTIAINDDPLFPSHKISTTIADDLMESAGKSGEKESASANTYITGI